MRGRRRRILCDRFAVQLDDNEVWAVLDREHLASVARKGPEPVFATISGAHLYGFASLDSDVDLRGALVSRNDRGPHDRVVVVHHLGGAC